MNLSTDGVTRTDWCLTCDRQSSYDERYYEQQARQGDPFARTGRSTRIALGLILDALRTPRRSFHVIDHYGTREANQRLLLLCATIVSKLDLQGFSFNQTDCTVKYNAGKL